MTTKTITVCDRCGATIVPAHKSGILHSKLEVTTVDREYINAPKDLCEQCTQSLKMWLGNLPNREIMYRQKNPDLLEGGTFADVVARIDEGASMERFTRAAWPDHNPLGWEWRSDETGESTRLCYFIDGYCTEPLTVEDLTATDWMELPAEMGNSSDSDSTGNGSEDE